MSSGKRFEKTFSRKKKETNNNKNNNGKTEDEEEELLISQLKSSSQQQNGKPKNSNGTKSAIVVNKKKTSPTITQNNKKKKEEKKVKIENEGKDQTQKQKRKAENGVEDVKKEKKPKKATMAKNQRKGKEEEKEENSECVFPMNRIVRIVKSEGVSSDSKISGEAVFLINKAAEKFIELFSKDAYDFAVEDRKSFVGYKHLASVVCKEKRLDFLSDFVPEKMTAEKALAERKPAETLPG